ncbi:MAG: hypothetical protein QXM75_03400 [Candidatus Diapherotrites archaeon]
MENIEREIIKNMDSIFSAFKKNRTMELRILANSIIRKAVKFNNKIMAEQSVIAYVLHKTLTKEHIISSRLWPKSRAKILKNLELMSLHLKRHEHEKFTSSLANLHLDLERIDDYFGRFVQSTVDKARIKYAADAYFLGASLGQAAELLSADKKTLLDYIGATKFYDKEKPSEGIGERLKKLKALLGE